MCVTDNDLVRKACIELGLDKYEERLIKFKELAQDHQVKLIEEINVHYTNKETLDMASEGLEDILLQQMDHYKPLITYKIGELAVIKENFKTIKKVKFKINLLKKPVNKTFIEFAQDGMIKDHPKYYLDLKFEDDKSKLHPEFFYYYIYAKYKKLLKQKGKENGIEYNDLCNMLIQIPFYNDQVDMLVRWRKHEKFDDWLDKEIEFNNKFIKDYIEKVLY